MRIGYTDSCRRLFISYSFYLVVGCHSTGDESNPIFNMIEAFVAALSKVFSYGVFKVLITSLLIAVEYAIGWWDLVIKALLVLMLIDFCTGFAHAWKEHRVSRRKMVGGIYKFILYFVAISTSHWTDIIFFHQEIEFGFQNTMIIYLWVTEALSIVKHLADLGIHIPQKIVARLESYREMVDTDDTQDSKHP